MYQTKINPNCYAHNGKPYWSTEAPSCICGVSVPYPDDNRCRDSGVELPKSEPTVKWSDYQYLLKEIHILQKRLENSESTLELKQQISEISRNLTMNQQSLAFANGMILQQRDQIHVLEKRLEAVEDWSGKDEVEHLERSVKIIHDVVYPKPQLNLHLAKLNERISALEESNATVDDELADNAQAIQRVEDGLSGWLNDNVNVPLHYLNDVVAALEKEVKPLSKYISDCDQQRFNADEELRKRIEKLEADKDVPFTLDKHNNDLFSRLESRIVKLEQSIARDKILPGTVIHEKSHPEDIFMICPSCQQHIAIDVT